MKMNRLPVGMPGKILIIMILLSPSMGIHAARGLKVRDLTCEHMVNPVGIWFTNTRLSWVMDSDQREQFQSAYQVLAASAPELLNEKKADRWNSGKVESAQSNLVKYGGDMMATGERVWWKVRVWDKDGKPSAWSEPAFFEVGLVCVDDWEAMWISPDLEVGPSEHPGLRLRKEFRIAGEIESARLYISSLGLYVAELNGLRVGDLVLTPGWTSYANRVQYQTYDVTEMLITGENAIGVTLADGWYRDFRQSFARQRSTAERDLELIARLFISYADGSTAVVVTDPDWKSSDGPVLDATIYNGETYDARLEDAWSQPGYDDSEWAGVRTLEHDPGFLVAPDSPPMRKIETIRPVDLITTPEGDRVIDMGQNMVGWMRISLEAPAGTRIILRHAEMLDSGGNFYTENLREAAQTNTYICRGEGMETWEPGFTFQGFRYVAVEGYPGELSKEMFTGIVVHSDLRQSGSFSCNYDLINQLQHNIRWGQKGNFLDVPTDCPQRDERLGWTGDAQVFAPTACYNLDCSAFYIKWLKDLALDQHEDGAVPKVIPNVLGRGGESGWQDAATVIPWTVFTWYGDTGVLEEQYRSMRRLVEYMKGRAGDAYLWGTREHHYGDWLAFATTRSDYPGATTDKDLLATAYFYHSADILRKTAGILGYEDEEAEYRQLMGKIKKAFAGEFITPNGRLSSNTQTAYVVALSFGLIPAEMEDSAAERLAADVRKFGHLTTGFLGTPDLCHVLTRYGYLEEAYMLLYRTEYPSWLYPVTMGATTIWERWDGQKPDGSFQNPGMNSFNHYAYGAIGSWLYMKVAGIDPYPGEAGFRSFVVKPYPGASMNDVEASHECPYGTIRSEWKIESGRMKMRVTVPVNTRARIYVPSRGSELLVDGKPASTVQRAGGPGFSWFMVEKGSGTWSFETDF